MIEISTALLVVAIAFWLQEAKEARIRKNQEEREFGNPCPKAFLKEQKRIAWLKGKIEREKKEAALQEIERQRNEILEFENFCLYGKDSI